MLFNRVVLVSSSLFISAFAHAQTMEERVGDLEARVSALEARLADAEAESAQVKERVEAAEQEKESWVSVDKLNPFVRHAWVNEAWTRPEPWQSVKNGLSPEEVVNILGEPTRTVRSLKPKVDLVYFYEGNIQGNRIRGKVSFRDGSVVSFQKPDFE
ncbi:MAG: hypothetical protein ACP5I4_00005 [Oceanipulchritudo sp.]